MTNLLLDLFGSSKSDSLGVGGSKNVVSGSFGNITDRGLGSSNSRLNVKPFLELVFFVEYESHLGASVTAYVGWKYGHVCNPRGNRDCIILNRFQRKLAQPLTG